MSISKMSSSNIWIIAMIPGLLIGVTLGYLYFLAELQSAKENENELKTQISNLQSQVNTNFGTLVQSEHNLMDAQAENRNLRAQNSNITLEKEKVSNLLFTTNFTLVETQHNLDQKKIELQESLDETKIEKDQNTKLSNQIIFAKNALIQLEADKKLLIEFRKDISCTRDAALQFWEVIKDLSIDVNYTLSNKVDNVITNINSYFDWINEQPGYNATLEEYASCIIFPPENSTYYGISVHDFILDFYLQIKQDIDVAIESLN